MYVQCKLKKGNVHQTSWIPKKFANLNESLKLKKENGEWDGGWVVTETGAETDCAPDWRKDIRNHKSKTGDSLPKQ